MQDKHSLPYWAVIPAAGVGKRMQSHIPKQYLPLAGKTVLEQSLSIFTKHPLIEGIVIAISDTDEYWPDVLQNIQTSTDKPILIASGGKERKDSVLSALYCLQYHLEEHLEPPLAQKIKQNAWVLVHDAARPCLLSSDIDKLVNALKDNDSGGLLGLPISDTLKRSVKIKAGELPQVEVTINRDNMWRALTPQQFKLFSLIKALELFQHRDITDESSAIELLGLKPVLVEGNASNIKITHPIDLLQAEQFFSLK